MPEPSAEQGDVERVRQLAARFGGLMKPGPEATSELLRKINDHLDRLAAALAEGVPGVMHSVDKAFYDLTVQQRDSAWAALERAEREPKNSVEWMLVVKDARDRAEKAELALAEIRENALSWHGPLSDTGHERALAVIATWADAALRPSEEASDES